MSGRLCVSYLCTYPINRFLSFTGGGENCPRVILQNFQPIFAVRRVISPRLRLKLKFSRQKCTSQLGDLS